MSHLARNVLKEKPTKNHATMKMSTITIQALVLFSLTTALSAAEPTENEAAEKKPAAPTAIESQKTPQKPMTTKTYTVPSKDELKKKLTELQWMVTQEEGTERPFQNEYWDNKEEGLYVCIVSGKPLFSSVEKFDSGTGWPSFYAPLEKEEIVTKVDRSFFSTRTEVRTKTADTHLGHVFDDAPQTPTGLRYCMNSAALRFVPKAKLTVEGYGEWLNHLEKNKK
jgi:peptide methionine sulfoxide reductase msrA/msrB